jgi:membrane protease YdiL (CAAX protease family)
MEYSPLQPYSVQKNWTSRIQAFFEVLLISGLFSSILAILPFYAILGKSAGLMTDAISTSLYLLLESVITFLLLAMLLKLNSESIRDLGLHWARWRPNVIAGMIVVPFLFIINLFVAYIFQKYFSKYFLETNPLLEIIRTPQQLGLFIFSALIAGGIKEELQRAFILSRFRKYLGGSLAGLVLWSIAFGAGHYAQGVQGIVVASIFGFIFGMIYLISGSLIAPIVAHSIYDTLALLGYWYLPSHFK